MSVNKLSTSYRCNNAIGNSLELKEMMNEVIGTFISETNAINGSYYLKEKNCFINVVSIGKSTTNEKYELTNILESSDSIIKLNDEKINLIKYELEKSCMIFSYEEDCDLDFVMSILSNIENRLNKSINACFNMEAIKKKNKELEELTLNLRNEIEVVAKQNVQKEKRIFEQLKMSQMGELIGNIAHQWRQPLTVISTAASGIKVKKELGMLTDIDLINYADSIVNNSLYLSNTIDEFRDYLDDSHKQKEVIIQERLKMAIKLVESSFSLLNIKIIEGYIEKEPVHFKLVLGELLQVLISIINNAKDALTINEVEDRWIKYELHKKDFVIQITIEDSAGGIPEEILDKIFNPYFTTKHQYQGTGVGLYSAYDIVVNRLNGKLYANNTQNGAKFFIELPLNINYVI